jgi:magnesium transporter
VQAFSPWPAPKEALVFMRHPELQTKLLGLLGVPGSQAGLSLLLEEVQPFDLAQVLPELTEAQAQRVLAALPASAAAEVVEHLEYLYQYRLLHHMEEPVARGILEQMSSDAIADLAGALQPKQAQLLLNLLPPDYAATIRGLMSYPENTAGGRMTVEYLSVRQTVAVEQVLEHIRKVGRDAETITYIYVVDSAGRLVGIVSLRELLLAAPYTAIADMMNTKVMSVPAAMDQEEVARVVAEYDFVAIPVVDDQRRLVGIITVDDLVDVMRDEATEDIQKLGGSEPLSESYFHTPIHVLVKKRIGWILVLFLAEAYTGTVLRHFEATLAQAVSLTFFIPLLIGTGGNTGSQIVTTLVRGLAVGDVQFRDMVRVLMREVATGLLIGAVMGITTLIRAYTLGVGSDIGPVVAVTAVFIVVWASIVAAVLPLVIHRLKIDPAVVSGPFITTLVDGTGLFMYFTVARYMLHLS